MSKGKGYQSHGSSKGYASKPVKTGPTPTKFHNRNLVGVSPNNQQFEPVPGTEVPQRYKMGGGA